MIFVPTVAAIDEMLPFVLLLIPLGMAIWQLYQGIRFGKMREYSRSSYSELGPSRPDKFCKRPEEPKTFWCLFGFYMLIVVVVPIALIYAAAHRPVEPPINPDGGPDHKQLDKPANATESRPSD